MLLEKYEPKTTKEIIGNTLQIGEVKRWLLAWKKGALAVAGPTGCGKDTAIKLIASELGYRVVKQGIEQENIDDVLAACRERGVLAEKRIIVLENAEFIRAKKSLTRLFEESANPVVIILGDEYSQNVGNVTKGIKVVRFSKPSETLVSEFLSRICRSENMGVDAKTIQAISKNSAGDVRSALIDLDLYKHGSEFFEARAKTKNIFETLRALFTGNCRSIGDYADHDMLIAWIDENIQKEYKNAEDIARAYEYLAKTDRFRSLVSRRQSWGLQKYMADMLTYGFPKKKISVCMYSPPARRKGLDDAVIKKVAAALHAPKKAAAESMDIIKLFLEDKEFLSDIGIHEDEAETLKSYG
jgi:replication factor C large subunit